MIFLTAFFASLSIFPHGTSSLLVNCSYYTMCMDTVLLPFWKIFSILTIQSIPTQRVQNLNKHLKFF